MAAKQSDQPTKRHSLASLLKDGETPEPFILTLEDGRAITFISPEELSAEKGQLLMRVSTVRPHEIWEILELWLTTDDYKAFRNAGLKLGHVVKVLAAVKDHFEDYFGPAGN